MADIPPETAVSAPVPADVRERNEDIAREGDKAWHMPEMHCVVHNHVEKCMFEGSFFKSRGRLLSNYSVTVIICKYSVTGFV